jgi:hypothetical protein
MSEQTKQKPFRYSFDSRCLDLAEHFLPTGATQQVKNELAQTIQDAVEDFFLVSSPEQLVALTEKCGCKGETDLSPHQSWCEKAPQKRGSNLNKADVGLCSDCPPRGWPTNETRCDSCPRLDQPIYSHKEAEALCAIAIAGDRLGRDLAAKLK